MEVFIKEQDETYYQHLLDTLCKSFIEVLKIGEMMEDEIKTGHIENFAVKATTQVIQNGSRNIGGKNNKEYVVVVAVGQQAHQRRPHHRYPQSQAHIHIQALYSHS